jgi:hypothetical protein
MNYVIYDTVWLLAQGTRRLSDDDRRINKKLLTGEIDEQKAAHVQLNL